MLRRENKHKPSQAAELSMPWDFADDSEAKHEY